MTAKLKDVMGAETAALVDAVAASAQQIWQAGLGAFARAQEDGGELFGTLVRGAQLHQLTQELAQDKVPDVVAKLGRLAEQVGRQATGSWDTIGKIFEDRVSRSLRSLGVPSRDEVDALRREVEALRAAIPERPPAKRTSAPRAAKAAAKPAPTQRADAAKGTANVKRAQARPSGRGL